MSAADVVDLESSIKQLPGVLGCVILINPDGTASEIQAFTRVGTDREEIQQAILDEVARRGLEGPLKQVFVFELEAEAHFGDRESLELAAETADDAVARGRVASDVAADDGARAGAGRPPIGKVVLSSTAWRSQAEVALGRQGEEVVGQASGERTPHGLKVLAQATLEAAAQLLEGVEFTLKGASLVSTFGREAVLVLVVVQGELETLGAALVRESPVSEAAVRASLDAVNRRLAQGLSGSD